MSQKIKTIYYFHPIYKYFTKTKNAQEGLWLPENSTDITPPTCKKGYIAVFHDELNGWVETLDNFVRTKCTNYELIYFSNTPNRIHLPVIFAQHIGEFNDRNFAPISNFFFQLKNFDNFVNPFLMSLTFKNRLNHLNNRIRQLYIKHHSLVTKFSQTRYMTMDEGIGFKIEKEEIIHEIKRIFDLLAITISIAHSGNPYFSAKDKLEIDSIAQLWSNRYPIKSIVKENLLIDKYQPLLQLVNNLHNGLKHDLLAEEFESSQLPREILIKVAKFRESRKNLENVDIYIVPFSALLYACNDYITDILMRKKIEDVAIRWGIIRWENKFM